jgi:hypothetical protein
VNEDLGDLSRRALVLRWMRDQITAEYGRVRDELDARLERTDRKSAFLGESKLGHCQKTLGRTTVQVTDMAALTDWVRQRHPTEIVESVRESYLKRIKDDAKHYGGPVDPATGEVIPGMEVTSGDPYVVVSLGDGADGLIADHWPEIMRMIPELPGGAVHE